MCADSFFSLQQNICTVLRVHLDELDFALDEYLTVFSREDFFSFADTEKRKQLYKKSYYGFLSAISAPLAHIDEAIARLSGLLVEADEAVRLDMLTLIGGKLEAFRAFETILKNFSDITQKEISKGAPSPSLLVNEARKLKTSKDELIKKLNGA